jgi:hypothetical protein
VEPLLEDVLVLEEPLLLVLLVPLLLVPAVESPEEPPPPPPQATTSNEAAKTAVTREIERGIMRAPGGRCTYVASRIAIPHAITACCRKATRRIAGAVPPRLTFAVGAQVVAAGVVVRPNDGSRQQRPTALRLIRLVEVLQSGRSRTSTRLSSHARSKSGE